MKQNAAIFILTQNNDVRRTYLKTCLYFLFKHFNAKHKYPVVILHEGDYDAASQREIIMGIRKECRNLLIFVALDKDDFKIPDHINREKLKNCLSTNPVPYWRDEKYRMMCRWWMCHFPKYAKGYDYVMRLDDDAFIEEEVSNDLFAWMHDNQLVYSSNFVHVDCGICCYGMRPFLQRTFPDKGDMIEKMFITEKAPTKSVIFHPFRLLLSITHEDAPPKMEETIDLDMPIMYYNNFFITKTSFWERQDVKKAVDAFDQTGNIFYYRWGDAPIQSSIVTLLAKPTEIKRAIFRYSKRLQRESFKDYKNEYHSYMPLTYDKSSCMTEEESFKQGP